MSWSRCRQVVGGHLALFLLTVAAAPHDHINGLEDLVLDQRSDSGIVVQTPGSVRSGIAPAWKSSRLLRDVPCLACFTGDFVAAPVASMVFVTRLTPLRPRAAAPDVTTPERIGIETSSRAPPALS